MLRILTLHLRLRPAAVVALALATVSLLLLFPRGAFAGAIEDQLHEALGRLDTSDLQTGVLYDRVFPLGDRALRRRRTCRSLEGPVAAALRGAASASADPTQRPSAEALIERAPAIRTRCRSRWSSTATSASAKTRWSGGDRESRRASGAGAARRSAHTRIRGAAIREWTYRGSDVRVCSTATSTFQTAAARLPSSKPTSTTASGSGR